MKTEPITIDRSCQIRLRRLWRDSWGWMDAANGRNTFYSTPTVRLQARDLARVNLDKYFAAIDEIVLKNNSEAA